MLVQVRGEQAYGCTSGEHVVVVLAIAAQCIADPTPHPQTPLVIEKRRRREE